jgi:hypothetical protein
MARRRLRRPARNNRQARLSRIRQEVIHNDSGNFKAAKKTEIQFELQFKVQLSIKN